nr:AraC family transcriptional regulator [Ramlibacter albus]
MADIQAARGPEASCICVKTSHSVVSRTAARSRTAPRGNLLLYIITEGATTFENAHGEQFRSSAGDVVLGSQDAIYRATTEGGADWSFRALSMPDALLPLSSAGIRDAGFQLLPAAATSPLATSVLAEVCKDFLQLDAQAVAASLRAVDHLIAPALAGAREPAADVADTLARHRVKLAIACMRDALASPSLGPDALALRLGISPRQLHRDFEQCGLTVGAEIRRLRAEAAAAMLRGQPLLPITEVAFSCGFDSLPTFFRVFKAVQGMTASEWRHGLQGPGGGAAQPT